MGGIARTVLLAMDAADPTLARRWAAQGLLPSLGRMLAEGSAATVMAPPGVFVSANWTSIATGLSPDRHGYLCWDEVERHTYSHRETDPNPSTIRGTPFWDRVHQAGHRQAIIDVPHSWPSPIDGTMVVEWGCHDRHQGTRSWPPAVIAELDQLTGGHPGSASHPHRHQFAPCDYAHRTETLRTTEEELTMLRELRGAADAKRTASLHLLDQGGWDLFVSVFGETHCVGHQLWHHHDPHNLRSDPAATAELGGDPVLEIYQQVDEAIGRHLDRLGPDDTAYLLLPHGMVSHNDGTEILDPFLARLERAIEDPAQVGRSTRLAAAALGPLPAAARRRLGRLAAPLVRRRLESAPADQTSPEPERPERRWYAVPNNSVTGAVRLNQLGREGAGKVHAGARREVLTWLRDRLLELVNVDTGRPVVTDVWISDDVYERHPDDNLADLYVEWERSVPIERVWSPVAGTIVRPYSHWRNGDHVRRGLLVARGPGIEPGATLPAIDSIDVAPTVCRSIGVDLPDVDGRAIAPLVPEPSRPAATIGRPRWVDVGPRGNSAARSLARLERRVAQGGADLGRWEAAGQTGVAPGALRADAHELNTLVTDLQHRTWELERQARIVRTAAWLRSQPAALEPLITVVTPTRNRAQRVLEAIASVRAQTHPAWELLVVDDASSDDTPALLAAIDEPRVRVLSGLGNGVAAARNAALDVARGEVIVYLDDDNRFDPDWLKSVAAAFTDHPETNVAYGARLVDDFGRHHGHEPNGEVWLQLLPWDRVAAAEFNRVDMNVLAHRRSDARFDERLSYFADWDLLLDLTATEDPREIFAVAASYTTTAPDRITAKTLETDRHVQEYELVRAKRRLAPLPP